MDPTLSTARLTLTPLTTDDADDMVSVLADEDLYRFTGGRPPTLDELRATYRRMAIGHSADGSEEWHNWIVRLRDPAGAGSAIGTVQATVTDDGRAAADIAWVIGVPWQGQGYATEAARALVSWLMDRGVERITAHIRPDHVASAAVATNVGLLPTDEIDADGERIWQQQPA